MTLNWTIPLVTCFLLIGLLLGLIGLSAAAPPPRPLCDACGDSFEATAENHGIDLTIEHSTAAITVHENGSASWVVRNHLTETDGAARIQANDSLRSDIADRAMWDTELIGSNVSAEGVMTIRYREPEFAERSVGGAIYTGEFTHSFGYRNLDGLGADRLVVIAPEGTEFDWTVPDSTVSDDGRRMTLTDFDDDQIVTMVPQGSLLGPLLSLIAVGSLTGPLMVINALAYVALPTAVFTILIGAAAGGLSWLDRDFESAPTIVGSVIALFGALVTIGSLLAAGGVSLLGGSTAPLFGVGIALGLLGVVLLHPSVRERSTYWTLVGGAALLAVVAAGATIAGALAFNQSEVSLSLLSTLPFLFPIFVLLPAGFAVGQGKRRLALATTALGCILSMVLLIPFLPAPFGLGILLVLVVTGYAAISAVIGFPLLVVGKSLATSISTVE